FRAGNEYRIGDTLLVKIAKVDMDNLELDLRVVKKLETIARPTKNARKRKTSQRSSSNQHRGKGKKEKGKAKDKKRRR
ncbi:MAG: hypothetical protein KDB27_35940, partial [Planctomycetales bacterium]|nr:hypothetical protein [Planctomycetales bacterium]